MNSVTRKPSLGVGRFSKSMAGVRSVTILCSFGRVLGLWQYPRSLRRLSTTGGGGSVEEQARTRELDARSRYLTPPDPVLMPPPLDLSGFSSETEGERLMSRSRSSKARIRPSGAFLTLPVVVLTA